MWIRDAFRRWQDARREPDEYPLPDPIELMRVPSPSGKRDAVLDCDNSTTVRLTVVKRAKGPSWGRWTVHFIHALNFGQPELEWTDEQTLVVTAKCDGTSYQGEARILDQVGDTFTVRV
jgi:hypothetical protein